MNGAVNSLSHWIDPSKTCCTRFFFCFVLFCYFQNFVELWTCNGTGDRAEKRLRVRAVDSSWRVFDRLINESLPPWTTLYLRVISLRLPLLTRWKLTNFERNPV